MTRDPGEIVRAGYDRAAARYRALEHDSARWPRTEWIAELTNMLRPGAAVLDLGCAAGVPVAAELASRYRVTGLDISPEHIQQAARNVPDAEFVCADARTVTFPAGHFDAIISLYTFDHIPRDEHRPLLGRLRSWLRPDGLLLLSIEDRDEPGTVAEWLGVDMYFSMFSADATRQLVREAGFDIEKTSLRPQTEGETDISYTWILARKALGAAWAPDGPGQCLVAEVRQPPGCTRRRRPSLTVTPDREPAATQLTQAATQRKTATVKPGRGQAAGPFPISEVSPAAVTAPLSCPDPSPEPDCCRT